MLTFEEIYYNVLKNNRLREYKTLSSRIATFSKHAKRRNVESIPLRADIRNPFAHDADRIMHCNAFARYMDKTQVFFQSFPAVNHFHKVHDLPQQVIIEVLVITNGQNIIPVGDQGLIL